MQHGGHFLINVIVVLKEAFVSPLTNIIVHFCWINNIWSAIENSKEWAKNERKFIPGKEC